MGPVSERLRCRRRRCGEQCLPGCHHGDRLREQHSQQRGRPVHRRLRQRAAGHQQFPGQRGCPLWRRAVHQPVLRCAADAGALGGQVRLRGRASWRQPGPACTLSACTVQQHRGHWPALAGPQLWARHQHVPTRVAGTTSDNILRLNAGANGAGVWQNNCPSLTHTNNQFEANTATLGCGGIELNQGRTTVTSCYFSRCRGAKGGALYMQVSRPAWPPPAASTQPACLCCWRHLLACPPAGGTGVACASHAFPTGSAPQQAWTRCQGVQAGGHQRCGRHLGAAVLVTRAAACRTGWAMWWTASLRTTRARVTAAPCSGAPPPAPSAAASSSRTPPASPARPSTTPMWMCACASAQHAARPPLGYRLDVRMPSPAGCAMSGSSPAWEPGSACVALARWPAQACCWADCGCLTASRAVQACAMPLRGEPACPRAAAVQPQCSRSAAIILRQHTTPQAAG